MPAGSEPRGVIHDIGYRPYTGTLLSDAAVARSLFLTGLRNCFGLGRSTRSKILPAVLLALMLVPAIVLVAIQVFVGTDEPALPGVRYPFALQTVISVFVAAQAPTLFARDLRYRTITLYLARPLQRRTYVLIRLGSLGCAIVVLIAAPVLLLYAGGLLGGLDAGTQTKDVALGLLAAVMLALLLGAASALVSAVTTRRGLAVAAVISVLLVGSALVAAVKGIAAGVGSTAIGQWAGVLSPYTLVDGILHWLFDTSTGMQLPPTDARVGAGQLACYAVLAAGSIALLLRRYRKVAAA